MPARKRVLSSRASREDIRAMPIGTKSHKRLRSSYDASVARFQESRLDAIEKIQRSLSLITSEIAPESPILGLEPRPASPCGQSSASTSRSVAAQADINMAPRSLDEQTRGYHRSRMRSAYYGVDRARKKGASAARHRKNNPLKSFKIKLKIPSSAIEVEPSTEAPSEYLSTLKDEVPTQNISPRLASVLLQPTFPSEFATNFPKSEPTEASIPARTERLRHPLPLRLPEPNSQSTSYPPTSGNPTAQLPYASSDPGLNPTDNLTKTQKINNLMRELWDTRRELSAAQAREKVLEKRIRSLDPRNTCVTQSSHSSPESGSATEGLSDLQSRLDAANAAIASERQKRISLDKCLADVERECRDPFLVPILLQTCVKISHLSDNEVQGAFPDSDQ